MATKRITINESFVAKGAHSSVTVTGQPLEHVFDQRELGRGPAHAIADLIREQIAAITEAVKPATLARRASARAALAKGAAWAVERYRSRPPIAGATKLFQDSGRLADLLVKVAGDAWEVLAPADRLGGESFTGGELAQMLERLRALVPALRAPLEQPAVREAIERTIAQIIRPRRR